jgi:hypothetical protein
MCQKYTYDLVNFYNKHGTFLSKVSIDLFKNDPMIYSNNSGFCTEISLVSKDKETSNRNGDENELLSGLI